MTIDLYYVPGSAPCRAVLLTAAAVGVELNKKMTDLMKGEHLKPEFLKMNPQHTIPTLDDDGFYLWESRAIMGYLVDKYAKNDSLFPKDPKSRALINQRLYFDHGTLYNAFAEYFYPTIFGNAPADPVKREKIDQALEFLDKFLEGQKYAAGKSLTIADLALAVTVSNFEVMNLDLSKFKNVVRWLATIKSEAPKYEETNGAGAKAFKELVDSLKKYWKQIYDMSLDLYYTPFSPPSRAVLLASEAIGISLNCINVDLFSGEQLKPEYEQLNPQKTVPLLIDGDFKLAESRAIMIYLVNAYGKNDRLYPKDPAARAVVNQRLYFDMGHLYKSIAEYFYPVLFMGATTHDPAKYDNLTSAYEILDKLLDGQDYVAGRNLTLADLSMVASVSTADALNFHHKKYGNVSRWYERVKRSAPGYRKVNADGAEIMKQFLKDPEA
ncbi:uncharacterized protein LOC124303241 [Neodiprion virginianus]|uniref:uncharacterized protein LOC124303241 n=1 Tax=Neodiprion virginianus TaxID=2961670 RepID=UPI001EE6D81C|nr:uncharacterized protein LOC124303241 [Neodiprion virginianus]